MNIERRIRKLESVLVDATGLIPHSEAWFAYYEDQCDRFAAGEDVPYIPLAVVDRIVEEGDRAAREQNR